MKIEFKNEDKINTEQLKKELGTDFKVAQEPYTETQADNSVEYHGLIIEIDDAIATKAKNLEEIARAHKPEFSDAEEKQALKDKEIFEQIRPQVEAVLNTLLADKEFITRLRAAIA